MRYRLKSDPRVECEAEVFGRVPGCQWVRVDYVDAQLTKLCWLHPRDFFDLCWEPMPEPAKPE
jgi:hypothetical protein